MAQWGRAILAAHKRVTAMSGDEYCLHFEISIWRN
jgi:hypothetical protein